MRHYPTSNYSGRIINVILKLQPISSNFNLLTSKAIVLEIKSLWK